MSVFDHIRLVVKLRHRSLQWYRSHQKIFIELGDTAPQSGTKFGNFGKSSDPSTAIVKESYINNDQKCSNVFLKQKKSEANFFTPYARPSEVAGTSYLVGLLLYTFLLICSNM